MDASSTYIGNEPSEDHGQAILCARSISKPISMN